MKIKEGGVMDIQKERDAFEAHIKRIHPDLSCAWYKRDENGRYPEGMQQDWELWQAAKAQAVPDWKDYTVESPRIDGPYQIFIMNQQLVAKWESPWGFSSIEDGDAFNQELITHWSVLGNDPAIEPREPAND